MIWLPTLFHISSLTRKEREVVKTRAYGRRILRQVYRKLANRTNATIARTHNLYHYRFLINT